MKTKQIILLLFLLLLLSSIILAGCSTSTEPGIYNNFAQCITDKGATMYGTDWCSHCQNQKKAFGSSFEYINYVDCDKNRDECLAAGVKGYPTWKINEQLYPGEQSLGKLATLTECELKEDTIV